MKNTQMNRRKRYVSIAVMAVFAFITIFQPMAVLAETSETQSSSASSQVQQSNGADEEMQYEEKADSWRYEDGEVEDIPNGIQAVPRLYGASVRLKGIDVSKWQGTINWTQVKNAGIKFAIIRCGYGGDTTKYDDAYFRKNVSECERLGIPYGVYLYSYADSVADAKSEAAHALRLLEGCNLSYPIYYDLEDVVTAKAGAAVITSIANTFCSTMENNGYRAGIYANLSWWNKYLTSSTLDRYEKWVAQWNDTGCTYDKAYSLWQYTSDGSVSGISGRVDMNYCVSQIDMGGIGTTYIPAPTTDVEDYEAFVTSSSVNYRMGPGTGYQRVGALTLDTRITITHTANGWGKMSDGNWVKLNYIKKLEGKWIQDEESRTVFQKVDGTIAKSQFISYLDKIYYVNEYGEKLTGFQTIGTAKYYLGSDGVAKSSTWVTVAGKRYYILTKGNLATGYKKIGYYYYGFDANGAMLKGTVTLNNKRYTFMSDGRAYLFNSKVKVSKLNYRSGPSTKYAKKGSYKKNKAVTIIRQQSGWGQMTNGYWLSLSYTSKVKNYPTSISTSKASSSYKVKVTAPRLNYRTGPSTSYKKKGSYKKGTTVTIKSTKSGWGKMSNGYWIKLSYTKRV